MKTISVKDINVFIMEDDIFFNNLLAKKIVALNNKSDIKNRFNLSIKQFSKPGDFVQVIENNKNADTPTVAFIDYYLGYGINGMHLVYLLEEINKDIKVVLLSQSEKIIKNTRFPKIKNNSFIKIQKHEYTPDICCAILENHMNNLS